MAEFKLKALGQLNKLSHPFIGHLLGSSSEQGLVLGTQVNQTWSPSSGILQPVEGGKQNCG